jgi:SAM-dependent methyltransferase
LAHYVRTELGSLVGKRVLHFAPEAWMAPLLRRPGVDYVSTDIDDPRADLNFDIQDIPLPEASVDVIVCSHVLEHVPDDRRATRELARILRPGGTALILVPQDPEREETYEDASITTPEGRLEHFWQADHLRIYGTDAARRLEDDGFNVLADRYATTLDPSVVRRHVMGSPGMYVATKP